MSEKQRILVISPGHPDCQNGEIELVAYNSYKEYVRDERVEQTVFLGRIDRNRFPSGRISMLRENEYLWEQSTVDDFYFRAANLDAVLNTFMHFIAHYRPTTVHVHHFRHLGLEIFPVIKNAAPAAKIIFTLHDATALCPRQDMLASPPDCERYGAQLLEACQKCIPEKNSEDIWLRRHLLRIAFRAIDLFICPLEVLRQQYVVWGVGAGQIIVIENGQEAVA